MTPEEIQEAVAVGCAAAFMRTGVLPNEVPEPVWLPVLDDEDMVSRWIASPTRWIHGWVKPTLAHSSFLDWWHAVHGSNHDHLLKKPNLSRFGRICTRLLESKRCSGFKHYWLEEISV